ncbi:ATP-binding protein [Baekduia soli]
MANSGTWRFSAEACELRGARTAVGQFAASHGVQDVDAVRLAVSEAVTNVILHAYRDDDRPGECLVSAWRDPEDGLVVWVCDDGQGMRPRPDSPGVGAGLPLIASVVQSLQVERRPTGGTRIMMSFAAG